MINTIEILRHIHKNSEHSIYNSLIDRDSKAIQLDERESTQNRKKESCC